MDSSTLAFLGIAALLVITPGADMALVARNGLAQGKRAAITTALGVNLGGVIWTLAAALGVAAFVRSSATAFNTLRIAGAVYLLYLGLQAIWRSLRRSERQEPMESPRAETRASGRTAFRQGVISNLLNPKIAVFYTSLIPQFVAPGQSIFARSLLLGGVVRADGDRLAFVVRMSGREAGGSPPPFPGSTLARQAHRHCAGRLQPASGV